MWVLLLGLGSPVKHIYEDKIFEFLNAQNILKIYALIFLCLSLQVCSTSRCILTLVCSEVQQRDSFSEGGTEVLDHLLLDKVCVTYFTCKERTWVLVFDHLGNRNSKNNYLALSDAVDSSPLQILPIADLHSCCPSHLQHIQVKRAEPPPVVSPRESCKNGWFASSVTVVGKMSQRRAREGFALLTFQHVKCIVSTL